MIAPVILIEAQPRRVADGVTETVRLAGGGALVPYTYGGSNDWRAGIVGLPTLIASLDYTGGDFPAGSVPAAAEIEWAPAKLSDLAAKAGYLWFDADITVRIGEEGTALPGVAISGRVLDVVASRDGKLRISLADPATKLKKPLLTSRFAGTGGLEGPVEWEGRIKRRIWGRVWNLRGEPIDKANNIYCYADPTRPLQSIDAVRDKGANAAALNTLAWQGSAAATLAALQAAAAPAGGGVRCPSIACVKWWTQPAGDLCADLKGEVGAGYVETTASIAQRLVEAIGGPAFAAGTVAAANGSRAAPVGWVADSDTTNCASMLDELLGNSSLMWLLDANQQLVIRAWEWGASVAAATSHAVARQKVLRPVAKRKLGYQRNELQMARGDLAAIVLADAITFADGTDLQSVQPAEPGATAGAVIGDTLRLPSGETPSAAELLTSEGIALGIENEGPFAKAQISTDLLTKSKPNLFPYPGGVIDGRMPAQLGWANVGAAGGFTAFAMGYHQPFHGGFYQTYRLTGGAAVILYPFYDLAFPFPGVSVAVSINGYCGGSGTFSPYVEALNAAKTVILQSFAMTYNAQTQRFEGVANLVANAAYLRIVPRGDFPASASYQDLTFYGVKVEQNSICTPLMGAGGTKFSGDQIEYDSGEDLNALKPAEAGATLGAPPGTPVGSITATDVSGTIRSGGGVASNQVDGAAIANAVIVAAKFSPDAGVDLNAVVPGALNTAASATQGSSIALPITLNSPNTGGPNGNGEQQVVAASGVTTPNGNESIFVNASAVVTVGTNRGELWLQVSTNGGSSWTNISEAMPTNQGTFAGTYSWSYEYTNIVGGQTLQFRLYAIQKAAQSLGDGTAGTNPFTITGAVIRVRRFFAK